MATAVATSRRGAFGENDAIRAVPLAPVAGRPRYLVRFDHGPAMVVNLAVDDAQREHVKMRSDDSRERFPEGRRVLNVYRRSNHFRKGRRGFEDGLRHPLDRDGLDHT